MTVSSAQGARIAVLGATGGVGGHVCRAASRAAYTVTGIARRLVENPASLTTDRFVTMDVAATPPEQIADLLRAEQVVAVVNATGGWAKTEEVMAYAHTRLVERLVEALATMSAPPLVVHIGSIHEYGPVPEGTLVDESTEPKPVTAYARTKFAGSAEVLRAIRAGRIRGTVLRAVNVCGPGTTDSSFLGAVVRRLRNRGPGEQLELDIADDRRDFVDVRDLADAVLAAIETETAPDTVNIGRGSAHAMSELVAMLVAEAGLPEDTVIPTGEAVLSKGGGWTRADTALARSALGWSARKDLRTSLRDMWEASATR